MEKYNLRKTKRKMKKFVKKYRSYDFGYLMDIMKIIFEDWVKFYNESDKRCFGKESLELLEKGLSRKIIAEKLIEKLDNIDNNENEEWKESLELYTEKERGRIHDFFSFLEENIFEMWD